MTQKQKSSSTRSSVLSCVTRAQLKVLERLFADEINEKFPSQFKSKHLAVLESEGYVRQVETTLPGRFPVKVKGWALTVKGHFTYCQSCADEPDP